MEWFNNLFKKKSEITTVTIFTINDTKDFYRRVACEVMSKSKEKIVNYLTSDHPLSSSAILNTKKPDLALCIHYASFMRKEGYEIVYLADDAKSKALATILVKEFKKHFKNKEIHFFGIAENDDGYKSLISVKNLKRKIFIKPETDNNVDEFSNIILNFLGKI